MDDIIKRMLETGSAAIEARKKFTVDRSEWANASEIHGCIRRQVFAKSGTKGDPQGWGYARRGNAVEAYVVECLTAANAPLLHAGADQVCLQDTASGISGTPDGVLAFPEGWVGIEIKSIDPRTNRNNLPKAAHVTQLKVCMGLLGTLAPSPLLYGYLIYVDASDFDRVDVYRVDADSDILLALSGRASQILNASGVDHLDREGKRTGECKYCQFRSVCGVTVEDISSTRKSVVRGSHLDEVAQRYLEVKEEADALDKERVDLRETILSDLVSRGVSKVTVGDLLVDLQQVKGRVTLDKAAVKDAGIDLSPYEKAGAPSERLTVQRI